MLREWILGELTRGTVQTCRVLLWANSVGRYANEDYVKEKNMTKAVLCGPFFGELRSPFWLHLNLF
jgi:hypothetical protein